MKSRMESDIVVMKIADSVLRDSHRRRDRSASVRIAATEIRCDVVQSADCYTLPDSIRFQPEAGLVTLLGKRRVARRDASITQLPVIRSRDYSMIIKLGLNEL